MKTTHTLPRESLTLQSIPAARRHAYFYTLLLLVAVIVSNMKESVIGTTADDVAKAKQSASKIVGTQLVQSVN